MKSTPLLLIMLLSLSTAAQNIVGKWVSYSILWRGKEYPQNEKKERLILILKKDSTYVKRYYEYESTGGFLSVHYSYHSDEQHKSVMSKVAYDSLGNKLKINKKTDRGTYSLRKSTNEIILNGGAKKELYSVENDELVLAIPVTLVNSTEKYEYIKFKREGKF
jgi:hypothetical protein